jgi:hypothetical protein
MGLTRLLLKAAAMATLASCVTLVPLCRVADAAFPEEHRADGFLDRELLSSQRPTTSQRWRSSSVMMPSSGAIPRPLPAAEVLGTPWRAM